MGLTSTIEVAPRPVAGRGYAAGIGEPLLELDEVSKLYLPPREPGRLRQRLVSLGGLDPTHVRPTDVDDDVDEGDEAVEEPLEEREPLITKPPAPEAVRASTVLDRVSFTAGAGTCVGVIGPAGAGKTTLLRIAGGLTPPSAGRVVVRGVVAPAFPFLMGLIPARRLSVEQGLLVLASMVGLPAREVRKKLREILNGAGVRGLGSMPLAALESRQRARLPLALALAVSADILLVDSPLGAGDAEDAVEVVLRRLEERRQAGALVVVTARERLELAELIDHVIEIEEGKIVGAGPVGGSLAPPAGMRPEEERLAERDLPLTPDAERYLEFLRVAVGDEHAEAAVRRARAKAASVATEVDWTGIAKHGGFDRREHIAVVRRLRRRAGVPDDVPLRGEYLVAERQLPLTRDAELYLDFLRLALGEERADAAVRRARRMAAADAEELDWGGVASAAGLPVADQRLVVQRLRDQAEVSVDEASRGDALLARATPGRS